MRTRWMICTKDNGNFFSGEIMKLPPNFNVPENFAELEGFDERGSKIESVMQRHARQYFWRGFIAGATTSWFGWFCFMIHKLVNS